MTDGPANGEGSPPPMIPARPATSALDLPSSEGVAADIPLPAARVMMVEPDPDFGRLLRDHLRARGWAVDWVRDGRDALRRWASVAPDLLLTEIQCQDVDGFELIETVNRLAYPPPIVVCTRLAGARTWTDEVRDRLGVSAVLVRPIRFPHLAQVLEDVIAGVRVPVEITGELTRQ